MAVQHPTTFAIANYHVAMADPTLSKEDKQRISDEFVALSAELPEPRWSPNEGPQAAAYINPADELFFGGSASGGKSALLLGLALTAHTESLILRREGTQLVAMKRELAAMTLTGERGLKKIGNGGEFHTYDERFIELLGCDDEKRASKLQGRPHDLKCVAKGTMILMGDGSYTPIERIEPGEQVMTLQGPKRVVRRIDMGVKPCVTISLPWADTVLSDSHQFLTLSGWADAQEALKSTQSHVCGSISESCPPSDRSSAPPCESRSSDQRRLSGRPESRRDRSQNRENGVWSEGAENGGGSSCASFQGTPPLPEWSVRLVLHERGIPLEAEETGPTFPGRARGHAPVGSTLPSFQPDCPTGSGFCDERSPDPSAGAQGRIPSRGDAADSGRTPPPPDDRGRTPSRIRWRLRYRHPYTKAWAASSEHVRVNEARIAPAGDREVFDLTVEDSAHYVTYGGIVSRNCWDEIGHFNEEVFRFVNGWNRSLVKGQRCRVVAAGNPPLKAEEEWIIRYWAPWLDSQHPLFPYPPGELLWFTTIDDKDEIVADGSPIQTTLRNKTIEVKPISRTFIPASITDNPDMFATGYASRLAAMKEPMRSQLLFGDMQLGRMDHPDQLIPSEWVNRSMRRDWKPDGHNNNRVSCAALDVAMQGADNMVLAKRYRNWIAPLIVWPGKEVHSGEDITRKVLLHLENLHMPLLIDVLATPGGSAVASFRILHPKLTTWAINFGTKSEYIDKTGKLEMGNLRAEAYWRLREALDPSLGPPETRLRLPDDPLLAAEICSVRKKNEIGYVQLEKKDEIQKRLGRSPDRADAVAMCLLADRKPDAGWLPVQQRAPERGTHSGSTFRYGNGGFMGGM